MVLKSGRYVLNMLLESCKELAGNPGLGKNYSDITPTLMGFKSERHIIFYRMIGADEIEVIRFLHEQMDQNQSS